MQKQGRDVVRKRSNVGSQNCAGLGVKEKDGIPEENTLKILF
jgi:hypothetical protein